MKTQRGKATRARRRQRPTAVRGRSASEARLKQKVARLSHELKEALEQQTATSEVLQVISSSPGELEPVFNTMLENATRICEAEFGNLTLWEGDGFRAVAVHGETAFTERRRQQPKISVVGYPALPLARLAATKSVVHVVDFRAEQVYLERHPQTVELVEVGGARTLVCVPMLKDDELIGAIVLYRQEVRPFTDKQIELVQNFAAQAVVAIENTRLLNELRQRTGDLSEALEQQTATSEVLRVISSSPGDLEPVFQSMLDNAVRICEARFGTLFRFDGKLFHRAAGIGTPPALVEFQKQRGPFRPGTAGVLTRVLRTKKVAHSADSAAEPNPGVATTLGGARSIVGVPMLKDNELVGAIVIYRQEVRPFTEKQIELVKNFASQAVIAIENARLLNELRQRTGDLTESLQQQTATSEVLRVISSSPGKLEPVFQAMLENATRICEAKFGILWLAEGDRDEFRSVALHGVPPALAEARQREPVVRFGPDSGTGRAIRTKQVVHIDDMAKEPSYFARDPRVVSLVERGGAHTVVVAPLLKETEVIGSFVIYRQEVRAFAAKQIELVTNFAAQAVIAIENTRLLNELRQRTDDLSEALEQQTATSEVLQVISSSPGELEPVFQAMLANAMRICDAHFGIMFSFADGAFRGLSWLGIPPEFATFLQEPRVWGPETGLGRLVMTKKAVHVNDARTGRAYADLDPDRMAAVNLGGVRTFVIVPMLKEGELVGAFSIFRQEVRPFTDKQIELVTNFAAQAVIAIENTRLLNELRQRTDELSEALEQQTATSEVLQVISSSPAELKPVFRTMLENATRICEAKFGTLFLYEGGAFRPAELLNAPSSLADFLWQRGAFLPPEHSPLGRLLRTRRVSHTADDAAEEFPTPAARLGGGRTHIAVPMLKENELIGAIVIYRQEVRPFTDKQIELVSNFAKQAVIAIENARLLNELRESLQQQTATADVLQVISSSPGELQPVFEAMLENATRVCASKFGTMYLREGDAFRTVAMHGAPPAYAEARMREPVFHPGPGTGLARAAQTKQVVHIADVTTEQTYAERDPLRVAAVELGGVRSHVTVPMLKENELIGAFSIYRQEVRPFTDKQIALLTNFASQAVIAIENTRLLSELRQRTDDLTESLQQQTATAEVLKVISRSAFELQPIFDALVERAVKLCEAERAFLFRFDGEFLCAVASYNVSPELRDWVDRHPIGPGRHSISARAALDQRTVHVHDVQADPEFGYAVRDKDPIRTVLAVPMLKGKDLVGTITIYRLELKPFTDKQIALVETFADQAVIAIENVRLFDEIQEKSRQLAEASQHKSQFLANMSHELRTPLNAILGYTELISDSVYGEPPEKMRDVLKRIEGNGRHLLGLINDVLDLSKIEAGQLVLALADYSLKDVVHGVFSAVEPLAAEKNIAFKVEVAEDLPAGRGDERRITQVLLNLVGNAIKFTDQGGVTIRASAIDGSYNLSVSDTGPGISEADQAKLFQEFQQADNSITRKKGGTGLGLAISKRIIEMQGGRIWLDSQLGQGSTFFVSLPVEVEQQARPT